MKGTGKYSKAVTPGALGKKWSLRSSSRKQPASEAPVAPPSAAQSVHGDEDALDVMNGARPHVPATHESRQQQPLSARAPTHGRARTRACAHNYRPYANGPGHTHIHSTCMHALARTRTHTHTRTGLDVSVAPDEEPVKQLDSVCGCRCVCRCTCGCPRRTPPPVLPQTALVCNTLWMMRMMMMIMMMMMIGA